MASAITRPSFTFNLSKSPSSVRKLKPQPTFLKFEPISYRPPKPFFTIIKSVDVSKEDKQPISETTQDAETPDEEVSEVTFDKRRLEEKFAVLNTGIYECRSCGFRYDEAAGDPSYPIPPGLSFDKLPEDWRCPTCGASQSFFESKSVEIAGFAQNQQFGLGGNALTSGQKALLIYGGLFLGFLFFLSGYFIQ
ncbi:Rubredoxin-like superfamily protein [Abeliophyllum distichum]|uniref:Rubredoxin-like superfamily protein n=1 Tax=Abeliophyllum distichum TaxID=126358 RepID=A0ABD1PBP3_9LAMI